jgi:hypothetical protein
MNKRPIVITVLVVMNYLLAAFGLVLAVVYLLPVSLRTPIFDALDRLTNPDIPSSQTSWNPFFLSFSCFLAALLFLSLAGGLLMLRNWARNLTIVFCFLSMISGKLPSLLGVLNAAFPNPGTYLLGYAISFALILYLVSTKVRRAFGVTSGRKKWLIPALSVLALASLAYDLRHSKTEFEAIRWHMRHGNRIRVSGVSFPVYLWYAPSQGREGADFSIKDRPGPLRSEKIGGYLEVKHDKDAGDILTVEQQADRKFQEFKKGGYVDLTRFQLHVGKEDLQCAQNKLITYTIDCYGEGPIASIFFAGGQRSLDRFQRMMSEAE